MSPFPGSACALLLLTLPLPAQTRLNAPLAGNVVGFAQDFEFSADGAWLVYVSDERTDETFELFAVPSDGSAAPVVLSGTLGPSEDVRLRDEFSIQLSPDGSWVAYVAGDELYRAPIDGSAAPLKLSGALAPDREVGEFRLTADGTKVVFVCDALVNDRPELFCVPADGSAAPTRLNGPLLGAGFVGLFELEPGNTHVLYVAEGNSAGARELYRVPLDASLPPVRLNAPLATGRRVSFFRITPDGSRALYLADPNAAGVLELHSTPLDGSAPAVTLTPAPVPGGRVDPTFELHGARAVFLGDLETDGLKELYSVPVDGSGPVAKLATAPVAFTATPDGAWILFSGTVGAERGAFRVAAAGGTPVLLSGAIAAGEPVPARLTVGPDGERCVYDRNLRVLDGLGNLVGLYGNLFSVPVAGGTPLQLTANLPREEFVPSSGIVAFTPDSATIVFQQTYFGFEALTRVRTDGTDAPTPLARTYRYRMNPQGTRVALQDFEDRLALVTLADGDLQVVSGPPLEAGTDESVEHATPTRDGLQVVYSTSRALHVVGTGGALPARRIDPGFWRPTRVSGSEVVSPDGRWVAYRTVNPWVGGFDLVCAPLRAPGSPLVVHQADVEGRSVSGNVAATPLFTADGKYLLYAASAPDDALASLRLHRVATDGSSPPALLGGGSGEERLWESPGEFGLGRAFEVSPDGTRVVYAAASLAHPTLHNLFSVPVLGGTPVRLSDLTLDGTSVYGNWEISPDGARVLYIAEQGLRLRKELHSAPIDGSAPAVRLDPGVNPNRGVGSTSEGAGFHPHARFTPDGTRLVFEADLTVFDRHELYSVPTDGSAAPVPVSGAPVAGGDVLTGFQLTPDGTSVVFLADLQINNVFELFRAPVSGGGPSTKLSGTLVANGDVTLATGREGLVRFGAGRVVFVADRLQDEVLELFSAPLDASSAPVRLSGPLVSGGAVDRNSIRTSADGSTVLYLADQLVNERFELFRAPIDGSSAPVRVNLPLPSNGDVREAWLLERGNRIVYRADQEVDGRFELYTLRLLPRTPRGPALPPPISGTVTRGL